MQKLYYTFLLLLVMFSCKEQKSLEKEIEPSVAEKIANAHGFEHWKEVKEVAFNFNGNRHWKWNPKTNDVIYTKDTITISYNRSNIDSTTVKIDKAFINDKFWLLIPFQLVWDKGLTISEPIKETTPISKTELNKITITYSNEGGYTPGDAYDIFYNDNFIIEEWIFRRANQTEPNLINTFENYQDFQGIKIALEHKKLQGNWNLKFSEVSVSK